MEYAPNTLGIYFSIGVDNEAIAKLQEAVPAKFGKPLLYTHVTIGHPMEYIRAGIIDNDRSRHEAVAEGLEDRLGRLGLAGSALEVGSQLRRDGHMAFVDVKPLGAIAAAHQAYSDATQEIFGVALPFSDYGYHITMRRWRGKSWQHAPEAVELLHGGGVTASEHYRILVNNVWRNPVEGDTRRPAVWYRNSG